jgi:8-oxo-dGTP pyrophosphatase MutT (NUDIX family)
VNRDPGSAQILNLDHVEALFVQREWAFARERKADIAAHWARLAAAKPAVFDGRVLVQYARHVEGKTLHARYLETSYSAFIAWRDFGWPDKEVLNGFAMAALRSRDGAFLLGEMGPHTLNAGKVYFAAGTPDRDDITPDGKVDLLGNALRELTEETGLAESEVEVGDGWTTVLQGQRMAFLRPATIAMDAEAARALILGRLSRQAHPELADIHIVRSTADIDAAAMPDFLCAYLEDALGKGGR